MISEGTGTRDKETLFDSCSQFDRLFANLTEPKKANEIIVALEALNNAQLLDFIKMIQTRRGDPRCRESVKFESEKSKAIGKNPS